jgi:Tol biopolymer transport system component
MVGTTLGHYRIVRALGSGGMGDVYAADDLRLNRVVALKVLPRITSADSAEFKRFQREAQAIAALNHPNVVTIYSVEDAGGVPFLTMELVEGRPLDALIPRQGMRVADLLSYAVPLADAVGAAHQRGIVHRDLKPSNIMVAANGRVKVLDFGLAKLRQDATGDSEETLERLTAEHRVVGTAAYMSPEQAEARPVDHRSDIFSLGILLYEMATGSRPFTGASTMSILSAIIKDAFEPPLRINPALPEELDRIIRRCLAKEPSRRYQSAIDLRNDLEELAAAVPSARRASRRSRAAIGWAATGAMLSAALVGSIAIYRARGPRLQPATFTRLTTMPGREWFPSLSPDGQWVVYGAELEGNFDIFLQSVSGSNPVNLTKDSPADDDMPAFSPDGQRIAFRSSREGGGIFVMGRTGEAVRRLTRNGYNPSWSPDGTEVAFTTGRMEINPQNSESLSELWVVPAAGGEARLVFRGDATQPSWSPHRRRIAFMRRGGPNSRADVWSVPVGGGEPVELVRTQSVDWNPVWAPDGRSMYFVSDRSGAMNLWRIPIDEERGTGRGDPVPIVIPAPLVAHPTISADGLRLAYSSVLATTNIQRLALDPASAMPVGEPAWVSTGSRIWSAPDPSPDGQLVVYYSRIDPEGHLFVSRADGTGQRQLTGDQAFDRLPHWSPDGQWISFFSTRTGRLQVWKIRPDGSELRQVTDVGTDSAYHAWSPDAKRMATATTAVEKGGKTLIIDPSRAWAEQTAEQLPKVPDSAYTFAPNSWSLDGEKLVGFTGPTSPSLGVVIYRFNTRTYERLTDFGEWPVWLPDSQRVLMSDGGRHFWVLDTRTKQTREIYSAGRDVLGPPRITRDGRAAYYSRRVTEADVHLMSLK